MAKTTCRDCNRTVLLVRVGDGMVATDPELIYVVPATHVMGPSGGGIKVGASKTLARRLHDELCESYQSKARADRLAAEMREYNKQQAAPTRAPRRNRGL